MVKVKAPNGLPVHNLDTGLDYATIQEAVDAANPGDTILVDSGVYYENIKVRKALTIRGENKTNTIVDGSETDHVFDIEAYSPVIVHNVTIQGFTIRGAGYYEGIFLGHSSNCKILDNLITDGKEDGIWTYYSSNNIIANNTVTLNEARGISIGAACNNNIIANNTVTLNGDGIVVGGNNNTLINNIAESNRGSGVHCRRAILRKNKLIGNKRQLSVSSPASAPSLSDFINDVDTTNLANGKPIYYWVNKHYDQIPCDAGVIVLVNCTGITVKNLSIDIEHIVLAFTRNSLITNNSLVGEWARARVVFLYASDENIFTGNRFAQTICVFSSDSNVFTCNTFENVLEVFAFHFSHGNMIYHNNFINYTHVGVLDTANYLDDGYANGGNYWFLWSVGDVGWDYNRDGLSDYPKGFDENNKDNYPLMGMFRSFRTSLGYNVDVVSDSTIEDFEFFESNNTIRMHISNMFANQTSGFCRVCIPHTLMNPDEISVIIDDGLTPVLYHNYTLCDNGTHRWIYFEYEHSTHKVEIVPEFPAILILPLCMIATLLAVIVYRTKRIKKEGCQTLFR